MLALCLLLLAARAGVLAELQTEEAACSSEPCKIKNDPMCGYDDTYKLLVYFLNECVFNCSNCLYRKAGSKAEFVRTNLSECLDNPKAAFVHECPPSTNDDDVQSDQADSLIPFPMFPGPGPVILGDDSRGTEGVSMGPLFPGLFGNPQWMVSNEGAPDFSSSSSPGSLSPDLAATSEPQGSGDIDRNVLTDAGDSNSDGTGDFGFIAPSFSPYMGSMFTDKMPVIDDNGVMETFPAPDPIEFADSPGPVNINPGFNPMLADENALQYLSNDSPEDASDDDILSDGILSMMDDSPSNDFGGIFPDIQIVPVDPTVLPTDGDGIGDSENGDPFDDVITSSSSEENDDPVAGILSPDDTIVYDPTDSSDESESADDIIDIITSILEGDSDDDADTESNPDESTYISVVYPEDVMSSDNDAPSSDITVIPQDVFIPLSDDTDVNPQDMVLPLSEGGLSGDQGMTDDVILIAMDPLGDNAADVISADSGSNIPADEGSEILILLPEDDSSDGSAGNDESDLSALSDPNDVPFIQELNVNPAQPEGRDSSGGFSNLLESMLLQKLLFNTDTNGDNSKQGNTFIDAKVHVEINVQPEEDNPSRDQHRPRYWNDDPEKFPKRPNFPGYGFRENDVDYAPAARQAALVMTTIGKAATSSSAINACSVFFPIIVSFFVIRV